MAFDSFLKIDGIEGESTDDKHNGWIEISSFNHEVTQSASATASSAGGGSTGRSEFGHFKLTKQVDKASPKLCIACADGTHFDKVVVDICRAGSDKVKYMSYELANCIISSYAVSGGNNIPTEMFSLDFGKITINYVQQKREGGGPTGNIASGWDRQRNCKL